MDAEFVVVGGGLMGLATAWQLGRRRREVVCLEQFDVGHDKGSSHGATRVFRIAYDAADYAHMARDALPLWRELEAESGDSLLELTGRIDLGRDLDVERRALEDAGIEYELLAEAEARARFPEFAIEGPVLFHAQAGVLSADRTVRALARVAQAEIRAGTAVTRIEEDGDRVRIETDGGTLTASVAVLCCGAWAPELLRTAGIEVAFLPTREQIAYVAHRSGELPAGMPTFNIAPLYGMATRELGYYKIAEHGTGAPSDPRTRSFEPDAATTGRLRDAVARLLPNFDPNPVAQETCMYGNTPDRDFVLDRRGRIVVGCGFSGHGFKFGPLVGRVLADLACGDDPGVNRERFGLGRDALAQTTFTLAPAR